MIMELLASKSVLRKELKSIVKAIPLAERQIQSSHIAKLVTRHPVYVKSKGVAVFLSMPDEVDTTDILKDIFDAGKDCYIPRYKDNSYDMTMVRALSLEDISNLPKTKWNIPQPLESDKRDDGLLMGGIDLILTPGLGFTRHGLRLGRGKGYYDKFFSLYSMSHPRPYLMGLAFQQCVVDIIPVNEYDFNLDEVVSPLM